MARAHHPATTPDLAELTDRLRASGGRVTTARRMVLAVVVEAGDEHLPADEVARRVQATAPDIHLSTVYRTLESLHDLGLLRQARLSGGPVSYHLAGDEHHHAVCSHCGAVINLPPGTFRPVVKALARDHGFVADPRHLTITGLCSDCADRAPAARGQRMRSGARTETPGK